LLSRFQYRFVRKRFEKGPTVVLRILVVDDEQAIRTALQRLLDSHDDWHVVGTAHDGVEAIAKAKDLRPDVVVMDISMPKMNGLSATPQIKKAVPGAEVLIFSQYAIQGMIQEAEHAGASGYLLKSRSGSIIPAIEALAQHKSFFDAGALSDLP
jgi:two-component system response regulator NreC